ncbi:hypothetical protein [Spiroplasma endosymbiont of Aspidapion aeneum]|uniref:hypothetical protein n=1 Tax=Spiroplasma endosymbiont of Aspidapion aeneum TaxID=3066276 RepID=UPI00313B29D3
MYITFLYNEKGNFYIAERVIGRIVEDIVNASTSGIEILGSEVSIPKGTIIDIRITIFSPNNRDEIVFAPQELIPKIREIIIDLIGTTLHNITFVFSKKIN